jgi:release factor glutamine methyltransferase
VTWPNPTDVGEVYRPAEDSDLLAGVAADRTSPGERVLDVGTGSGYVAAAVAGTGADVVAADLNPHACRAARDRVETVVRADLVAPFRAESLDRVTFNPPYLPTPTEEERDDWMGRALSGGPTGRAVIDRFLDDVGRVLAPGGEVLLLASTLAGVDEVASRAGEAGFSAVAVAEESFPFETLTVLALVR